MLLVHKITYVSFYGYILQIKHRKGVNCVHSKDYTTIQAEIMFNPKWTYLVKDREFVHYHCLIIIVWSVLGIICESETEFVWSRSTSISRRRPWRRWHEPWRPVWDQRADEEGKQPGSCAESAGSSHQGQSSGHVTRNTSTFASIRILLLPSSSFWFEQLMMLFINRFFCHPVFFGGCDLTCQQIVFLRLISRTCSILWSRNQWLQ